MSELWTKWEGQVVDGRYPLRRCLGVSDHSGVFLTEDPTHPLTKAAFKLVPAIPTLIESQLAHWNVAAGLSHPRLLRLFSTGRCQLDSMHCLYVAMDYAEQNLAQLLANRPLTEGEVRELLPPTLEALAFLHSRNLVHGHLKPSNVMVVGDQLKLASDTVRPAGEAATSISMLSPYDPPEARDGSFSTAGDVWALGVTLYEALTRTTPVRPDERSHGVILPSDFPAACADVIRECLSRRADDRPSVARLQAWMSRPNGKSATTASQPIAAGSAATHPAVPSDAAVYPTLSAAEPPTAPGLSEEYISPEPPEAIARQRTSDGLNEPRGRLTIRAVVEPEPAPPEPPRTRILAPVALGAVVIVALGWGAWRLFAGHPPAGIPENAAPPPEVVSAPATSSAEAPASSPDTEANPPASEPSPQETAPNSQEAPDNSEPQQPPVAQRSTSKSDSTASVVHEEIPDVPRSALSTIHGHVKVAVGVSVDASGAVVDDSMITPGPSRYFARIASQAARKWKFDPAAETASRQWVVHFEFSRTGTTAHASPKE
jgi:TonB family protein